MPDDAARRIRPWIEIYVKIWTITRSEIVPCSCIIEVSLDIFDRNICGADVKFRYEKFPGFKKGRILLCLNRQKQNREKNETETEKGLQSVTAHDLLR
jgi:hypothetical protein